MCVVCISRPKQIWCVVSRRVIWFTWVSLWKCRQRPHHCFGTTSIWYQLQIPEWILSVGYFLLKQANVEGIFFILNFGIDGYICSLTDLTVFFLHVVEVRNSMQILYQSKQFFSFNYMQYYIEGKKNSEKLVDNGHFAYIRTHFLSNTISILYWKSI